eukprot:CAMPEP_0182417028 /NCGR_PEP_ID=MMETSP1167-20130531/1463_1 /TAXON_ID=2988 /ORGANISM="Mallomonas Sp, Strain CCMP3275" /LENGTH=835 /DNA_ID=CAMNT_0024590299 /DNA_START=102 /DNA_END=2606 /DNA_ORIENTATION=+
MGDRRKDYGSLEQSDPKEPEFEYSHGLSSQAALQRLQVYGRNELPEKVIPKWYIFVSQLWQPMPIMIWLASIIEAAIGNFSDMAILLFIQFANASISYYETTKAGDAVAALKASLKPEATVKRDGKWEIIDAAMVVPGDMVLLATGSAIPADCRINEGQIDVDQAQLTGESLPVTMYKGDSCKMGSTVVRGEVEGTVEFTGADTFFGKTASLLQGSSELSNLQKILVDITLTIVLLSTLLCTIVFVYLLRHTDAIDALSFVVVLMVASIPLAIEIVTTTTLALGSKELANHGAIVTRLAAIEDMAGMAILCADKTGTLTMNRMEIQPETPVYQQGENQYSLLRYAAMAARWKEPPRDALDKLVLKQVDLPSLDVMVQNEYVPFDPVIKRTEGTVTDTKTNSTFKVTKGAPHVLLKLVEDPDKSIEKMVMKDITEYGERGVRCLAVAKTNEEGKWVYMGMLTFLDPPRPDTKQTIEDSRDFGVRVKMITGDHLLIARETARRLGLGDLIRSAEGLPSLDPKTKKKPEGLAKNFGEQMLWCDGFAQVFPEHKYLIVECLRELGYKIGMTGDGVNDAPALKRADVGVAVSGATDAARAAADIVLTKEGLSTIVHGIITSRIIFVRIRNFITYRIAATLQLLVFFFIAVFAFKPRDYQPSSENTDFTDSSWPEYFHMPVMMLMLITLLNDGTLIAIGYDNVIPLKTPERWNLRVLFFMGSVMASVALFSSLILLYCLLNSWSETSFFHKIGLGGISYGQITTSIYLKVSVSDFLTLFSVRCGEDWLWASRPAPVLLGAASVALSCSTILACVWPPSYPDGIYANGLANKKPYGLAAYIW